MFDKLFWRLGSFLKGYSMCKYVRKLLHDTGTGYINTNGASGFSSIIIRSSLALILNAAEESLCSFFWFESLKIVMILQKHALALVYLHLLFSILEHISPLFGPLNPFDTGHFGYFPTAELVNGCMHVIIQEKFNNMVGMVSLMSHT